MASSEGYMKRLTIVLMAILLSATFAEARRSLMDDVMKRPSAYTQNKMRMQQARTDYRIRMMDIKLERQRMLNTRIRMRQHDQLQQHYNKLHRKRFKR